MLEVYKFITSGNCSFPRRISDRKVLPYGLLKNQHLLELPQTMTDKYGNKSLSFRGSTDCSQTNIKVQKVIMSLNEN